MDALRAGDAFQLGYLPQQILAHFNALDLLVEARAGAEGELSARVEAQLRALPERGPEVVSAVWQTECVLAERLRVAPPPPPTSAKECDLIERAARAAIAGIADSDPRRVAYELGMRAGVAESVVAEIARLWTLWSIAPGHAALTRRAGELRRLVNVCASLPMMKSECPTMNGVVDEIATELARAIAIAERAADDGAAAELAQIYARLGSAARALEAAAWGTPRQAVAAWREKRITGTQLMWRLAEHPRWNVPCRVGPDGKAVPEIFQFDKKVAFAFGDVPAVVARPKQVRPRPDKQPWLTIVGGLLFQLAEGDVLVVDATDDPASPATINYPRELHATLKQVGAEVLFELAACNWSHVDRDSLRAYRFWLLTSGSSVRNLMAPDGLGRPRLALFSSESALDAHLELATPEQKKEFAMCQRVLLPGEALFPSLAKLQMAVVLNPSGPGRTRTFNHRMMELCAAPKG